MATLLVYTENYWPGVAGESYLVDLVNGARSLFDSAVVAFNPEALNDVDLRRLTQPATVKHVPIMTSARIWKLLHERAPVLSSLLVRLAQALDPLVFAYNVAVLRRLIRSERPSAVLAYNGGYPAARSVLAMALAAEREDVPVALSVVSMPAPRRRLLARYEAWLDRRVGCAADVIIVNAPQIALALQSARDLPPAAMRIIHNALPDSPERVSRAVGGRVRIGCVARMDGGKGIPDLLEAFASIAGEHPEADLVLVGDGPELPRLKVTAAALGCADRITFTGYYDGEVASITATFDIYAYPSHWEGLPYAILEAMRAGCAIVATDVGGIPEAVIDGETGLLVAPRSPGALSAALERMLADRALRSRLGEGARCRYETEFSLSVMHERTSAVLSEVLR